MDLPPNFVGMSERQQLRYLSEQAEAANKPPEPVAAEPVKKKKPKKRPRAFVVESILDKRVCLDTGRVTYLVKWDGYDAANNTWEPASNLTDCDDAVKKFEKSQAVPGPSSSSAKTAQRKKAKAEKALPLLQTWAAEGTDDEPQEPAKVDADYFGEMDSDSDDAEIQPQEPPPQVGKEQNGGLPECWANVDREEPRQMLQALAMVVGVGPLTVHEILTRLWKYLNQHDLTDGQMIQCDTVLAEMFPEQLYVADLPREIARHLVPIQSPDVPPAIDMTPEELSLVWISRDNLATMSMSGTIGELATGCLVSLVSTVAGIPNSMARVTSVLQGEEYMFARNHTQVYLQHVPSGTDNNDVARLDQVSNTCFSETEVTKFKMTALFDEELLLEREELQEKQQQLDAFFRQDELSRLSNVLHMAQERNDRAQVKKLQGEIERCKKGSKSRVPPFKVPAPDLSSNEAAQQRHAQGVSSQPAHRGSGPVHRGFAAEMKGKGGKGSRDPVHIHTRDPVHSPRSRDPVHSNRGKGDSGYSWGGSGAQRSTNNRSDDRGRGPDRERESYGKGGYDDRRDSRPYDRRDGGKGSGKGSGRYDERGGRDTFNRRDERPHDDRRNMGRDSRDRLSPRDGKGSGGGGHDAQHQNDHRGGRSPRDIQGSPREADRTQQFVDLFCNGRKVARCEARAVIDPHKRDRPPFDLPKSIVSETFAALEKLQYPDKKNFMYVVPCEGEPMHDFDSFIVYLKKENKAAIVELGNRRRVFLIAVSPNLEERYPGRNLQHCLLAFDNKY